MIETLIKEGNYLEALKQIGDNNDELSLSLKARCLYELQRYEEALSVCKIGLDKSEKLYYEIQTINVLSLMELEKDEEAIKILEEELSMPYIPYKFDEIFNSCYNSLIKKRRNSGNNYSPYDLLKDDELKELLNPKNSNEIITMAIYQLQKRNVRMYMDVIKEFLISKAPNYLKTLLLEVMSEQDINEDLNLFNGTLTMEVNPSLLTPLMEQVAIPCILDLVHKYNSENNLTINQDAYDLLMAYLGNNYPMEIEEDEYPYIACAIYYACLANYDEDAELRVICGKEELNYKVVEAYYDQLSSLPMIY